MIQPMGSFQLLLPHYEDVADLCSAAVNLGNWTKEALEVADMWGSVSNHIHNV